MRELIGKRALITGAASGIGRAIALALADEKTHVYLLDINEAGAKEVAAAARLQGVEAVAAHCDVIQPAEITAAIRQMLDRWPAIDLLVNNVGICYYGPTENMTAEQWDLAIANQSSCPDSIHARAIAHARCRARKRISSMYAASPAWSREGGRLRIK